MSEPDSNSAIANAHLEHRERTADRPSPGSAIGRPRHWTQMGELRQVYRPELEILSIARRAKDGPGHRKTDCLMRSRLDRDRLAVQEVGVPLPALGGRRPFVGDSRRRWIAYPTNVNLADQEIGGANVVSASHRESPRFFPGSGT